MIKISISVLRDSKAAILFLLLIAFAFPDTSFDVPYGHPVYNFLSTIVHPTIIDNYDFSRKPYSRKQVVFLLNYELSENPSADRLAIKRYLSEFSPDSSTSVHRNLATFSFKNAVDSLEIYPAAAFYFTGQDSAFSRLGYSPWGLDSLTSHKDIALRLDCQGVVQGHFNGMALYFKGSVITQYNTRTMWNKVNSPDLGQFYTNMFVKEGGDGHGKGADNFETYLKFPLKYFDLKAGRSTMAWGISDNAGLLMSGNSSPFFNIRVSKNIRNLSYDFVWGRLTADTYLQKRYLYAKRIGYQPFNWLSLGFTDEVITINRDLEPVYFLPAVPFFFAEHYVGDLDNRLMSIDLSFTVANKVKIYSELMMDDIRNLLGFFDTKDVANKWGVLAGVRVARPIRGISSAQLEFTQIEPWVFTTSVKENRDPNDTLIFNYPVHFGSLIGTPLGPNSRSLRLTLRREMSEKIQLLFQTEQIWKGWKLSSFVDDINGRDNMDNFINMYKDYRFYPKGRNRTVVSASANYQAKSWNLLSISGNWVHENAFDSGDYFSVNTETRFNF
jgi:hypothetical protein